MCGQTSVYTGKEEDTVAQRTYCHMASSIALSMHNTSSITDPTSVGVTPACCSCNTLFSVASTFVNLAWRPANDRPVREETGIVSS